MKRMLMIVSALLLMFSTVQATPIDFNDYAATAYKGQPQNDPQGTTGTFEIWDSNDGNDGGRLALHDDVWANFEIGVTIAANTWMHIEVRDRIPAWDEDNDPPLGSELLGLQFLDTFLNPALESQQAFSFAGNQDWGIMDYRVTDNDWTSFDINIGAYFTGTFKGIVFYVDDDGDYDPTNINAEGRFQNLEFSSAPVPEPATMMLFGIGLLGLAGVSRRRK